MSTWLAVTGASRGLGRAFAVELSRVLHPSLVVLTARTEEALGDTIAEISALEGVEARLVGVAADFSDISGTEAFWEVVRREVGAGGGGEGGEAGEGGAGWDKGYVIENAGVLWPLGSMGSAHVTAKELGAAVTVNATHFAVSTQRFLEFTASNPPASFSTLVNISSLAAIKPFPSWGAYCAGKAFRDMLVGVTATEKPEKVRLLSYGPGPCDTDMHKDLRESEAVDKETQEWFRSKKEEGGLVRPQKSAEILAKLITENSFDNGAHVDITDVEKDVFGS